MSYTISKRITQEAVGDSVSAGTIASPAVLTITPEAGFVVSASDFTANVGGNADVDSVSFADTGTAGALGNTIEATVTLASALTMTAFNTTINVSIAGKAVPWQNDFNEGSEDDVDGGESANIDVAVDINESLDLVSLAVTSQNGSTVGAGNVITLQGIQSGSSVSIARIVVTATGGNKITEAAFLDFSRCPESVKADELFELKPITVGVDGDQNITSQTFDLVFTGNRTYTAGDALVLNVVASAEAIEVLTKELTKVEYGSDVLTDKGETRKITVFGTAGAQFDFDIQDSSNNTTITGFTPLSNIVLPQKGRFEGGPSDHTFEVTFPAASEKTYNLLLNADAGTSLGTNVPSGTPTYTINQYGSVGIDFRWVGTGNLAALNSAGTKPYPARALSYFEELPPTTEYERRVYYEVVLSLTGGSTGFTKLDDPVISNWSASDGSNAGTYLSEIGIENAVTTVNNADQCTLTFTTVFYRWGNRTVYYTLDLDSIITYA